MEDIFQTKNDIASEVVYCGRGRTEDHRFLISIKLSTVDFKLADYLSDGQTTINFKLIRKKKPDQWHTTHFVCLSFDEQYQNDERSMNDLTLMIPLSGKNNFGFSLTITQIKKLMFNIEGKGNYLKLELLTNGVLCRLFRYIKKDSIEKKEFREQ